MFEINKIKLLDNYQLYQLLQSDSIDKLTIEKLKKEFNSRNLTSHEKFRISNKYQQAHPELNSEVEENKLSPLFTAFALNTHFRYLALLKVKGKKKEVKKYMIELYIGLALYFALFILLIMMLKAKNT